MNEKMLDSLKKDWEAKADELEKIGEQLKKAENKTFPRWWRAIERKLTYGHLPTTIFDHIYAAADADGKIIVVSEPYSCSQYMFEELIEFCRKFDLTFSVRGYSYHNPLSCFRIEISPATDTKE